MASSYSNLKSELDFLLAQRETLEIEASALFEDLTSKGPNGEPPAGVNHTLVDSEGFPRADINIYEVKQKRLRLRTINTDHKLVMKKIEELMPSLFLMAQSNPSFSSIETITEVVSSNTSSKLLRPIAKLDQILPDSPAERGQIQEGDLLLAFGNVTCHSLNPLSEIPAVLKDHIDQDLRIQVDRNGVIVDLTIRPCIWSGRGILGCHLSPI